jgi:Fe-S cluster assembly protein SufD
MTDSAPSPTLLQQALAAAAEPYGGDGAPAPFTDQRVRARLALERLGFPTRSDEAWKYTDLRPALAPDYALAPPPASVDSETVASFAIAGLDAARLVFVDGRLAEAHSDLTGLPEGILLGGLRALARTHPERIAEAFGQIADVESDAFAALNAAFEVDGPALIVPRGTVAERPIHVVHVQTADAAALIQSRGLLLIGENAQATLVETVHALGSAPTFRNEVTEVVVGRAARLEHVRIQDGGDAAHGVSLVKVHQEASSVVSSLTFTFATGTVRNNSTLVPAGEGCESHLGGLYICHGEQHVDTSTLVDHVAPGCMSNELFKGIVYDRSTGVFNGKVFVRRAAQQTNAYQQSQGVILSPDAHHFSKPELEIYADDVKCSHGSTTGSIDVEALFYLRSRGISESDARAMLLYAFAHDVVEMVSDEALRTHLDARIAERLT